jgi:UDP-glucose 4-epimerase
MPAVFVTGGSGFLGSLLIRRLLNDGHVVTNIDLVPSEITHSNLKSIVGDIRNRPLLDGLLQRTGHFCAYHCAALLARGLG